jgi:SAM-dependent methyltransferase
MSQPLVNAFFALSFLPATVPSQHGRIPPEQIVRFEPQVVEVPDFQASGYILDIGGGGEGVIGQLKPAQVVAIDLIPRELAEAPPGPLKIVMDARELKFLDGTFQTATAFFSLMYMEAAEHPKVLAEIHRVLAPGGRLLIWDGTVPAQYGEKKWAMFRLHIRLPAAEIKTGYGVKLGETVHDAAYYARLAEGASFTVSQQQENGRMFYLELRKASGR